MKRILVTGSRDWDDYDTMIFNLNKWYRRFKDDGPVILVSGNAIGADLMAEDIWADKVNSEWIERYPASDFEHPLIRNDFMISQGADVCLAFACPCIKTTCQISGFHLSHGSMYTADNAKELGIEIEIFQDLTKPPF